MVADTEHVGHGACSLTLNTVGWNFRANHESPSLQHCERALIRCPKGSPKEHQINPEINLICFHN